VSTTIAQCEYSEYPVRRVQHGVSTTVSISMLEIYNEKVRRAFEYPSSPPGAPLEYQFSTLSIPLRVPREYSLSTP
jgi:hypothetical protein